MKRFWMPWCDPTNSADLSHFQPRLTSEWSLPTQWGCEWGCDLGMLWGSGQHVATTAPRKGRRSIWVNFITTLLRPSPGIMVYVREIIPKLRTIQVSEILQFTQINPSYFGVNRRGAEFWPWHPWPMFQRFVKILLRVSLRGSSATLNAPIIFGQLDILFVLLGFTLIYVFFPRIIHKCICVVYTCIYIYIYNI